MSRPRLAVVDGAARAHQQFARPSEATWRINRATSHLAPRMRNRRRWELVSKIAWWSTNTWLVQTRPPSVYTTSVAWDYTNHSPIYTCKHARACRNRKYSMLSGSMGSCCRCHWGCWHSCTRKLGVYTVQAGFIMLVCRVTISKLQIIILISTWFISMGKKSLFNFP